MFTIVYIRKRHRALHGTFPACIRNDNAFRSIRKTQNQLCKINWFLSITCRNATCPPTASYNRRKNIFAQRKHFGYIVCLIELAHRHFIRSWFQLIVMHAIICKFSTDALSVQICLVHAQSRCIEFCRNNFFRQSK